VGDSIPAMSDIAASSAGSICLALLTCWVGYASGIRRERERGRRGRNLTAASELVAPLRALQVLLRQFGREDLAKSDVARAFLKWSKAYDGHGHRLPDQWRHLARSVRDATGTVFGGISLVHVRPNVKKLDLAEPDALWQDFADDYLDYAASSILRWGDSSVDAPKSLMSYEAWLVTTGRRKAIGSNRSLPSAGSALIA
jgi:hypothetical protein